MNDQDVIYIPLQNLFLDPENPRLPAFLDKQEERQILTHIAETTSIEDLMSAIAENGYFPGEPLIVVPKQGSTNDYIVVEGNRRLTAVKLLSDPHILENPGRRLLSISQDAANKPDQIPVIVRNDRSEILPYLGFRHITGIREWEPLAKARYMRQLMEALSDKSDEPSERYATVARKIGSRRDHIKRSLDALAVYEVIEENDFFNIESLDEESVKFAVLSTGLADERIATFTGVSELINNEPSPTNPIISPASLNRDNIQELTEWMFKKDEKGRTRLGESRKLRELAAVISNEKALEAFRHGASLSQAYRQTKDIDTDFLSHLYQCEAEASVATSMVSSVDFSEEAMDVARRIRDNIKLIGNTLRDKQKNHDDDF